MSEQRKYDAEEIARAFDMVDVRRVERRIFDVSDDPPEGTLRRARRESMAKIIAHVKGAVIAELARLARVEQSEAEHRAGLGRPFEAEKLLELFLDAAAEAVPDIGPGPWKVSDLKPDEKAEAMRFAEALAKRLAGEVPLSSTQEDRRA